MQIIINVDKTLEDLIMKTREELKAEIQEVKNSIATESAQVQTVVGSLKDVINVLSAKVLQLQSDASTPVDFSEEFASIQTLSTEIDGIYSAPSEPVEESDVEPIEEIVAE